MLAITHDPGEVGSFVFAALCVPPCTERSSSCCRSTYLGVPSGSDATPCIEAAFQLPTQVLNGSDVFFFFFSCRFLDRSEPPPRLLFFPVHHVLLNSKAIVHPVCIYCSDTTKTVVSLVAFRPGPMTTKSSRPIGKGSEAAVPGRWLRLRKLVFFHPLRLLLLPLLLLFKE